MDLEAIEHSGLCPDTSSLVVPTEENGIFMLGLVFYSVNFHQSKYPLW